MDSSSSVTRRPSAGAERKHRLIVLTDISVNEPDDHQSMRRLILYSNEFEILGLVTNPSMYGHFRNHPEIIGKVVADYAAVRPNLMAHATGWPTREELDAVTKAGQGFDGSDGFGMAAVGEGKDSPGSDLIIRQVDAHPGPIWILGWGGVNTLAQALWRVRATRPAQEVAAFVEKIRVYDIAGQDDSGAWMCHHFPELFYARSSFQFRAISPRTDGVWQDSRGGNEDVISLGEEGWIERNVRSGHGDYGAGYPHTRWQTEGDTPTFLFLIPNGLNPDAEISYGSWGGRFEAKRFPGVRCSSPDSYPERPLDPNGEARFDPYHMYPAARDSWGPDAPDYVAGPNSPYVDDLYAPLHRWREAFQNDFAARLDWTLTEDFEGANHPPVAAVEGPLERTAAPGEVVPLDARGSTDPHGRALSFRWFQYPEAGTFPGGVEIQDADSARASFLVPKGAREGETIHVVLAVKNSGVPPLTRYRRVIVTVAAYAS